MLASPWAGPARAAGQSRSSLPRRSGSKFLLFAARPAARPDHSRFARCGAAASHSFKFLHCVGQLRDIGIERSADASLCGFFHAGSCPGFIASLGTPPDFTRLVLLHSAPLPGRGRAMSRQLHPRGRRQNVHEKNSFLIVFCFICQKEY